MVSHDVAAAERYATHIAAAGPLAAIFRAGLRLQGQRCGAAAERGRTRVIFLEMLSYPFLVRAFVVGVLVSLCAALLGTSLVLKRFS